AALWLLSLAWGRADRGALEEARRAATYLTEVGHPNNFPLNESRGHWVLAEVLRREGDLAGAEREIQLALELIREVASIDYPSALGTLSFLRLAQGRAGDALAVAEEALSRYDAMGACGFFRGAFVRLAHVEALEATGDRGAASAAVFKACER